MTFLEFRVLKCSFFVEKEMSVLKVTASASVHIICKADLYCALYTSV
jgi:hypothetical protein